MQSRPCQTLDGEGGPGSIFPAYDAWVLPKLGDHEQHLEVLCCDVLREKCFLMCEGDLNRGIV